MELIFSSEKSGGGWWNFTRCEKETGWPGYFKRMWATSVKLFTVRLKSGIHCSRRFVDVLSKREIVNAKLTFDLFKKYYLKTVWTFNMMKIDTDEATIPPHLESQWKLFEDQGLLYATRRGCERTIKLKICRCWVKTV